MTTLERTSALRLREVTFFTQDAYYMKEPRLKAGPWSTNGHLAQKAERNSFPGRKKKKAMFGRAWGVRSRARLGKASEDPWLARLWPCSPPRPRPPPASPPGFPSSAEAPPAAQVHEPQIEIAPWHLPTHSSTLSSDPPKYSPNLPTSPPHLCRSRPPSSSHQLFVDCRQLPVPTGVCPPPPISGGDSIGARRTPCSKLLSGAQLQQPSPNQTATPGRIGSPLHAP